MFPIQDKFILVVFLLAQFCYAQTTITGKVIDIENNLSLSNVEIVHIGSKTKTVSDYNGLFEVFEEGSYSFKKEGYVVRRAILKFNQYSIVQLEINPSELDQVVVSAHQIPKVLKKETASISIISSKDIDRSNHINFTPVLNRSTGVFMQTGALNTNRITIRGVGSRSLFGTAKIRAYFKEIPLTNGSGETNIEDFELSSLSRIDIIKGAASSVYGAGIGGLILLNPKKAPLNQSQISNELSFGSFGLIKDIFDINYGTNKQSFNVTFSTTMSDGYRENNNYNRQTFTISTNHFLDASNEITFLGSYVDLKAFIPSSINETQYLNAPKTAAFSWKASKGFEDSKRGMLGLSWKHSYNERLSQNTSVFSSFKKAYEPRPFNILDENTLALGIRTRLLGHSKCFGESLQWTFGGEVFMDRYNYKTYENLYQEYPQGTGSVQGDNLSNFKEKRYYYNGFVEMNYEVSPKTTISVGFNLNRTSYKLEDNFETTSGNPDQSGHFKFKHMVSPNAGISYGISKNITFFSSVSHGFSPISLSETLMPDGQINNSLKPETGWNFEFGSRGRIINERLQFEISVYRLSVKNLLVSRRVQEDQFIGVNAGKTLHDGLELQLNYDWMKTESASIGSFVNYTLNNYKFKEFLDRDNDFSGNDLTGVPSKVFNAGIDFNSNIGLYGNINYQYVGHIPITDSNSLYSKSYNLTNLKIGYQSKFNKYIRAKIFIGINNLFSEKYASQLLINASGFNGALPRYFYPGHPINYYTGLKLGYSL